MSQNVAVRDLVYDETFRTTGVEDFGVDMGSALSGAKPVPPEGVRVNVSFEGELKGPRLRGKVAGTDYLIIRADRVVRLDVHAVITTDDGARIALHGDGVADVEGSTAQLRENATLHTSAPAYAWVNRLQVWATGQSDLATGVATLKAYTA
jgi:hypothetical protein